jgi:DNA anti-recombination protein RmuC
MCYVQQEAEIGALTRRIRLVDEDLEQTSARLHTASQKLEEASQLAEETERSVDGRDAARKLAPKIAHAAGVNGPMCVSAARML